MPRETDDDWTNIRHRLTAVPEALEGIRASFLYAADGGKVAARRQALACADSCEIWGQPDGVFCELAAECKSFDLTAEAERAASAFVEFGRWLRNDYAAMATPHDPVGAERYRLLARFHNGTDLDLDGDVRLGVGRAPRHRTPDGRVGRADLAGHPAGRMHRAFESRPSVHGGGRRQLRGLEPRRDRSNDRRPRWQVLRHRRPTAPLSGDGSTRRRSRNHVLHTAERRFQPPGSDLAPRNREDSFSAVGGAVDRVPRERPRPSSPTRPDDVPSRLAHSLPAARRVRSPATARAGPCMPNG